MVLPLYLAMTAAEIAAAEIAAAETLPRHLAVFDPPAAVPPGTMGILTDRIPCRDPIRIAEEGMALNCPAVLLDFEGKPDADSRMVANALFQALPCPVAAPPGFLEDAGSPVFLPPCPLHVPLAEYLGPWQGREVWLDVTLGQQAVTVTAAGTVYAPTVPADRQGGVLDEMLLCRYVTEISGDAATFTLFDTPETLKMKLAEAARYGVTRAVGLYQELAGKL